MFNSQEVASPDLQLSFLRRLAVLLGVPIDSLDMAETLDRIEEFVIKGRSDGKGRQVATANVDFLVKAQSDPELLSILQNADLVTADGMPLVWGARLLGIPFKERVAGSDFVPLLAGRAARKGFSIFLLGATPQVAQKASEILTAQNPGLTIVGVVSPPVAPIEKMDPGIVQQINQAHPDLLLVAFGNPKQEKWISRNKQDLHVPVMIGIGGTLDFITGHTKRAPRWTHTIGLEWVHRLSREPQRLLKRYLVDLLVFGSFFTRQWITIKVLHIGASSELKINLIYRDCLIVAGLSGDFTLKSIGIFEQAIGSITPNTSMVLIDLEQLRYVDAAAIGALLSASMKIREGGGEFAVINVPERIRRIFSLLKIKEASTLMRANQTQTGTLQFE